MQTPDFAEQFDFEPSEQLPILQAVPRYLLIDQNELRALGFKKHTASFLSVKLDYERDASSLMSKDYETVFVDSESFEAMKSYFMAFKREIVVIDNFRDVTDWLRCAYYGDENGCRRFNAKPNLYEQNLRLRSELNIAIDGNAQTQDHINILEAEVENNKRRNFWQRLVYLFKGE